MTILCVDDEPDALKYLQLTFEEEGYQVISAEDYESAVNMAQIYHPDLICLDVQLPGKNGHEVLKTLKADASLAKVPVVVVSATNDEAKALQLGASRFLPKPVGPEELVSTLEDILTNQLESLLIVEDDADTAKFLASTFQDYKIRVRVANNGQEGLTEIAREIPSAIVLDLEMPVMDGFELLNHLKNHPQWAKIPVVLFTSRNLTVEELSRLNPLCDAIRIKGKDETSQVIQSVLNVVSTPNVETTADCS